MPTDYGTTISRNLRRILYARDVRTAKELMGHSDIRTTANIYDHCDTESLMVAAQKISS